MGGADELVHVPQYAAGPVDHGGTDGGGQDLAVPPLEKGDPEAPFEFPDLGREGRLADEAGLGGPSEMAVVVHRHQVAELLQGGTLHNFSLSFSSVHTL